MGKCVKLHLLSLKSNNENGLMADTKGDYTYIKELLYSGEKKILIITHRNPDGDAIGSSLGLLNTLVKLGHEVDVLIPNRAPAFLSWMKGADKLTIFNKQEEKGIQLLKEAEILFALDFNDLSRVREFEKHLAEGKSYKLLIDHHPNPSDFADFTYSDTAPSSTCEMLYNFIHKAGLEMHMDSDIASCIYAGILTDTGCFNFNSSRPETFHIVASLLEFGIHKDNIYDKIFDNFSFDRMKLMGHCLDKKMIHLKEYNAAYLSLDQEEMRQYNFKVGDSEGFVNLPLSVTGVKFSVLFTEHKDIVKLSLRSKGDFAVNTIASEFFSGGGHRNAAGGESKESLEKTIEKFMSILPLYRDELQG